MRTHLTKMLNEDAITLLLKEHSYFKKRRIFSKEELEARTVHLFNECEYSICTLLNSTPPPNLLNQSTGVNQLTTDINVTDAGFQYEGFVHFRKTHYMETYRELISIMNKTSDFKPPDPTRSAWNHNQIEVYEKLETIINEFFHGSEIILQEKNTSEYKMRRYRLLTETVSDELTRFLNNIFYCIPDVVDWLINAIMDYYTDYQLRCYIELLTMVLPHNLHLTSMLKFYPSVDWFDNLYHRKVFGSKIVLLYDKFLNIWSPDVEATPPQTPQKISLNPIDSKQINGKESNSNSSMPFTEETTNPVDSCDQDVNLLIIPPLPCFVTDETDDTTANSSEYYSNFVQCERISIFEKHFKNVNILDYKIKPLDQKDFNDEMIQWWINDLGCVIQRRILSFRKMEPLSQLYIVGWLTGASLAYKIFLALLEHINGIVMINLPTNNGIAGIEKVLDTRLLYKSNRPIIFVASSESQLCNLNELREIRATMSHQTSFICAHYCDDFLTMKSQTKKRLILTQDIIDVMIVESIRNRIVQEICSFNAIATSKLLAANRKTHSSNAKNQRKSQTDTSTSISANNPCAVGSINQQKTPTINYNNHAMPFTLANTANKIGNINDTQSNESTNINNNNFRNYSTCSANDQITDNAPTNSNLVHGKDN